jgi:hypothetical protein
MRDAKINVVEVVGPDDNGAVVLMRAKPGMVAVTVYHGDKPVTVIVSAKELQSAVDRLASKQ